MKCDTCGRQMNYCFYIDDKFWLKAIGKKEGHICGHCILEKLGGLDWYIIWNEPKAKSNILVVKCVFCDHEWNANCPDGLNAHFLECPKCGEMGGTK